MYLGDHDDRDFNPDVSTAESHRNDLFAEEFPEGPYGSDLISESLGKSSPWRMNQHAQSAYGYENKALHAGLERDYPGEDDYRTGVPEVQDEP
ncbi:hypothetical protein RB620_23340 [Paenibacillus sp. LHD-117]|uniref:hypothetical protein n=1 Tax=Paenibacillus sp. LHD-117 TaxID=3071412 RepID=UPI0027DEC3CB|nr:hypothetical protein [Paenibacillus sp. LHD-117]MDQ6422369.1 hypothetical protein [Paenibacillus sp. LHD-117]